MPHTATMTGFLVTVDTPLPPVVAWRRVTDFVHANSGAKICLQLGHSGAKGSTKIGWEGMDQPL